jgi:hypothetical protein
VAFFDVDSFIGIKSSWWKNETSTIGLRSSTPLGRADPKFCPAENVMAILTQDPEMMHVINQNHERRQITA